MPSKIPTYYWDSCVLLSGIEGVPDRIPTIETLLSDCREEKVEILTSHLSITEVAFVKWEKDGCDLDDEIDKKIESLWDIDSPIKTVEVYELITRAAKQLMRSVIPMGFAIKPADAIHLATAKVWQVDEFHTYDHKLFKYEKLMGFKIGWPHTLQLALFPTPGAALRGLHGQQSYWSGYPITRVKSRETCHMLGLAQHRVREKTKRRCRGVAR